MDISRIVAFPVAAAALTASLGLMAATPAAYGQAIISTVAGGGPRDMPSLEANVGRAGDAVADPAGNVYFTSESTAPNRGFRIFKLGVDGLVTLVAGTGTEGFSGDGGPAIRAAFGSRAGSLALDYPRTLYVADSSNGRVRKISFGDPDDGTDDIVTTVVGPIQHGPVGLALDAARNLYVGVQNTDDPIVTVGSILKVDADSGEISPVMYELPQTFWLDELTYAGYVGLGVDDMAIDAAGNIYTVNARYSLVHKIDTAGAVSTIAGGLLGNLAPPGFYVCFDLYGFCQAPVAGSSGDGGPAGAAGLHAPRSIVLDATGNLYVAESGLWIQPSWCYPGQDAGLATALPCPAPRVSSGRVRKVDLSGTIATVVGNGTDAGGFAGDGGPATLALLNHPGGLAIDAGGNLFVADTDNHRIRRMDGAGTITTVAGSGAAAFSGEGHMATSSAMLSPSGVAVDRIGNLYLADPGNHRVRKVTSDGVIRTLAGNGSIPTDLLAGDGGLAVDAQLHRPSALAVDADGNVYIADPAHRSVRKVNAATGTISTVFRTGNPTRFPFLPAGVAVDGAGNVFIADASFEAGRVLKVSPPRDVTEIGNYDRRPLAIAVDEDGNILVVSDDREVVKILVGDPADPADDVVVPIAGGGTDQGDGIPATLARLSAPVGIAVSGDGSVYIHDAGSQRVRKVDATSGLITTVAGTGSRGFSGDGGEGVNAALASELSSLCAENVCPHGLAVDAAGTVYIADRGNDRIRKLVRDGTPPVIAASVWPHANEAGWHRTPPTVTWSVEDPETGITTAAGCEALTVASDTSGVAVTCSAINAAGLSTSRSVTIKLDTIAPTIVAARTPEAAASGWSATDVTVSFGCADEGSGIASCTAAQNVTTEGAGQSVTGIARDAAGNLASATVTDIRIDKTPPVLTALRTPAATAHGWNNTAVRVDFTCADTLSGVTQQPASVTVMAEGADQSASATCQDAVGNIASARVDGINIDRTAPIVTGTPSRAPDANGWYNRALGVAWSGADALSGIDACTPASSYVGPDTAGTQLSGSCQDLAGNAGHAAFAVRFDATAPVITVTRPSDNLAILLNETVAASYLCSDALSGAVVCTGSVASGAPIDASTPGRHGFTVKASDAAGNASSLTREYSVRYGFSGFLAPLNSPPTTNRGPAGRTFPVKWRLADGKGAPIGDAGAIAGIAVVTAACGALAADVSGEESTLDSGGLRYDPIAGEWQFNWKTQRSQVGCWTLEVRLADGTTHRVSFDLR